MVSTVGKYEIEAEMVGTRVGVVSWLDFVIFLRVYRDRKER